MRFQFKRDQSGGKTCEIICLEMIVENIISIRLPKEKLVTEIKQPRLEYLGNTKSIRNEAMSHKKSSQRYKWKTKKAEYNRTQSRRKFSERESTLACIYLTNLLKTRCLPCTLVDMEVTAVSKTTPTLGKFTFE